MFKWKCNCKNSVIISLCALWSESNVVMKINMCVLTLNSINNAYHKKTHYITFETHIAWEKEWKIVCVRVKNDPRFIMMILGEQMQEKRLDKFLMIFPFVVNMVETCMKNEMPMLAK